MFELIGTAVVYGMAFFLGFVLAAITLGCIASFVQSFRKSIARRRLIELRKTADERRGINLSGMTDEKLDRFFNQ